MLRYLKKNIVLNAPTNDDNHSGRAHKRSANDYCTLKIGDKLYPVENWSMGGALFYTHTAGFGVGQTLKIEMKFKLHDRVLTVPLSGTIARKSSHKVALKFDPLTDDVKRAFQLVMDDRRIQDFMRSQKSLLRPY